MKIKIKQIRSREDLVFSGNRFFNKEQLKQIEVA